MSAHIFDPEVAKEVGVNAAVIYQSIAFWCEKNAANGKHIHEGRAWTYNSVKAWGDLFPYLTADQIRRALEKLVEAGFIGSGSFSDDARDRTKWFCDLRQMHLANMPTSFGNDANSYKGTVVNTDVNNSYKPSCESDDLFSEAEDPEPKKEVDRFAEFWAAFPRKLKKPDALKAWKRATRKNLPDKIIAAAKLYSQMRAGEDEKYTAYPASWLNAERFNDPDHQPVAVAPKPERWVPGGYVR